MRCSPPASGPRCYDNAPMESFFHTLKTELVHNRHYATRQDARGDIFAYIEGFYNRTRRHSAIGYISPIEIELKATNPVHFSGEDQTVLARMGMNYRIGFFAGILNSSRPSPSVTITATSALLLAISRRRRSTRELTPWPKTSLLLSWADPDLRRLMPEDQLSFESQSRIVP
jgi:hypothetical protein